MTRITDFINEPVIILAAVAVAAIWFIYVFIRASQNGARIKSILAKYPNAEKTSVFLPSGGDFSGMPSWILEDKKKEMESAGWTYLDWTAPLGKSPDKPGVTLYFIRIPSNKNDSESTKAA
jgi:hypothetical protein